MWYNYIGGESSPQYMKKPCKCWRTHKAGNDTKSIKNSLQVNYSIGLLHCQVWRDVVRHCNNRYW